MTLLTEKTGTTAAPENAPLDVVGWVERWAEILRPDRVEWLSGSARERHDLISLMVDSGTLETLNPTYRHYSFIARSEPSDVARIESRTFICSATEEDAGPTNNWINPDEMRSTLGELMTESMRGRTMYVVPFSMGPLNSPIARFGVQITDSPYVALSLQIMVRVTHEVLDRINQGANWVKCIHTVGAPLEPGDTDVPWPCNETKYISHFPETREIWSFGSAYGGNALLPKKAFALRIASVIARDEGWLAEHMLLVRVTSPEGKIYHLAAAFPSACGKTNFAMLQPTVPGWKVETLGDDIAWLAPGRHGELRAINPEAGLFGVAPGTSEKTNPVAMEALWGNTIFTNVAVTPDGDVWWEGMTKTPPAGLTDWRGQPHDPSSGAPAAHPNARFTVALDQVPTIADDWENPDGVVVDAIIFGGRRSDTTPLVVEARDWDHGVFLGATMASEQTAAAEGTVGTLRRDPFAMLPFMGYHVGDYLAHWLRFGEHLRSHGKTPRIFQVNWFRKDASGRFLWPGFGDNIRAIAWMIDRIEGRAAAESTPFGLVPRLDDQDTKDWGVDKKTLRTLLTVRPDEAKAEFEGAEELFQHIGPRLPQRMRELLDQAKASLEA